MRAHVGRADGLARGDAEHAERALGQSHARRHAGRHAGREPRLERTRRIAADPEGAERRAGGDGGVVDDRLHRVVQEVGKRLPALEGGEGAQARLGDDRERAGDRAAGVAERTELRARAGLASLAAGERERAGDDPAERAERRVVVGRGGEARGERAERHAVGVDEGDDELAVRHADRVADGERLGAERARASAPVATASTSAGVRANSRPATRRRSSLAVTPRTSAANTARKASRDIAGAYNPGIARMANLMLVDDDLEMAEVFMELLQVEGHHVRLARNGVEGLALLSEGRPDAILCDVEMPLLDGPGLAYQLLLRDAGAEEIPFILVSGVAESRTSRATSARPTSSASRSRPSSSSRRSRGRSPSESRRRRRQCDSNISHAGNETTIFPFARPLLLYCCASATWASGNVRSMTAFSFRRRSAT